MPYKYLRDPLFLFCVSLYFLNRLLLKPLFSFSFVHNSLNDLICIPFWVPIMLWALRKTGLRADDAPPQWYEIAIPLVCWSIIFEMLVPYMEAFQNLAHSDPLDVFYYTFGAFLAATFWKIWYSDRNAR